ncbi:hypothetical protein [Nocardioides houyundeii]|uniref:hypothetical protein n=1 Tax=Nocardioides houyundeii TaxID=2045452 RepID=UPI0013159E9A|nr:hypothetical protein [Nocardioides houyundeii]
MAANILADTRAGFLLELGEKQQVTRQDRVWANTNLFAISSSSTAADGIAETLEKMTRR